MIGKKLRFMILERDGFRCQYCGKSYRAAELHVDHVKPKSRGGSNHRTNLVTACRDCNLGKGALIITRSNQPVEMPSEDWPNDIQDPVFFTNAQWAATGFGLECLESFYPIPADELQVKQGAGDKRHYEWPVHMAEKSWVDIEQFIQAFLRAIDCHGLKLEESVFDETITLVGQLVRETQRSVRLGHFRHGPRYDGAPA